MQKIKIYTLCKLKKKKLGQYFTISNPFKNELFDMWFKKAYSEADNKVIIEPFAGNKDIVQHINTLYDINIKWMCYDIDPKEEDVMYNDSIYNFPKGYSIAITNPPYLAKVSASRLNIDYPETVYDDIYKLCLDTMLYNCDYVAAIIPESFVTANIFHQRLYGIISLNMKMFNDTECPVCLALFVPNKNNNDDFVYYIGNNKIGTYKNLLKYNLSDYCKGNVEWKFNDKEGCIGVKCVDNQTNNSIYFHNGELIEPSSIKVSSRAFTRISGLPNHINREAFINECNNILNEYRQKTHDIFLTSFKGLRKDGVYRRRIDFKTIKCIMNKAISNLKMTEEDKKTIIEKIRCDSNGTFIADEYNTTILGWNKKYDAQGRIINADPNYKDSIFYVDKKAYPVTRVGWYAYIWRYSTCNYLSLSHNEKDKLIIAKIDLRPDYVKKYEEEISNL